MGQAKRKESNYILRDEDGHLIGGFVGIHFVGIHEHIADWMVAGFLDGPGKGTTHILLGPIIAYPNPEAPCIWCVAVACGDESRVEGNVFGGDEHDAVEQIRNKLLAQLSGQRRVMVHDHTDELDMARHAETLWPEKYRSIRRAQARPVEPPATGPVAAQRAQDGGEGGGKDHQQPWPVIVKIENSA